MLLHLLIVQLRSDHVSCAGHLLLRFRNPPTIRPPSHPAAETRHFVQAQWKQRHLVAGGCSRDLGPVADFSIWVLREVRKKTLLSRNHFRWVSEEAARES